MKGIILAGGSGSRLYPITLSTSKQLLPIYDKPMIYYPLTTLMQMNIRNILIISSKDSLSQFKLLLGDGKNLGINIKYAIQDKPRGIADALILTKEFISNNQVCLILGDNLFYGQQFTSALARASSRKKKCTLFVKEVKDPERFGILNTDKTGNPISIVEKPKKPKSNLAITGLYFFDNKVIQYAKRLKPSKRNEVEIVDLLNFYKSKKQLSADLIGRGGAWLDTGSIEDFYKTSAFVSAIENRQGFKIACLEEISLNKKWIGKKEIIESIKFYGNCEYSNYLKKLIN